MLDKKQLLKSYQLELTILLQALPEKEDYYTELDFERARRIKELNQKCLELYLKG